MGTLLRSRDDVDLIRTVLKEYCVNFFLRRTNMVNRPECGGLQRISTEEVYSKDGRDIPYLEWESFYSRPSR